MKILFVFQDSGKSVYFESLTAGFLQKNIQIEALFLSEKGILQTRLEQQGITCHNYIIKQKSILSKAFYKARYIVGLAKKIGASGIFSHLVYANFYAAIASYFLPKIKVVCCRHNADEFYKTDNVKARRFDKIVNVLAPHLLVISETAKRHVIEVEKVSPKKVSYLPLAYDFTQYDTYENSYVAPKKADTDLRIVTVSRLVDIKRIDCFFPIIKHFKEKNKRIELHIIGDGPLENNLKKQVNTLDIADLVTFLGHQDNVIPHIQAADIVGHLSVSESSNQVVKEAGYCGKTVIACRGVGDFDTYLNDENAYLLDMYFTTEDIIKILENILNPDRSGTEGIREKGENLRKTVLDTFSINDNLIKRYIALFS
jgi:glycosyltransferase involved in cell wall biosynthesis